MTKKILFVDDEPAILTVGKARLAAAGYDVVTESNGAKALDAVKRVKPDLVILDIHLPGMTGYDVFEKMQEHSALAKIPVIFTSADANVGRIEIPFQGDLVSHLPKPWPKDAMIEEVERLLSLKSR